MYDSNPQTTFSPPPAPTPSPTGRNGLATAGFVLGLLGLLGSWIPLLNIVGIILGILGAILALVGLLKSKSVGGTGKGLAIAGLVLGGLAVVIAIVMNVAFVGAVDDAVDEATKTTVKSPGSKASTDGESEDESGTTRSNPAPIGSEISGGDWSVTVNSVATVDSDQDGERAAAGHVLLEVNITATYNGTDEQGDTSWTSVKFVGEDGTTVDGTDESAWFVANDPFDSMKTVYNGGTITGNKLLEVPDTWQSGVLAVSPELFSDDTFVAVK